MTGRVYPLYIQTIIYIYIISTQYPLHLHLNIISIYLQPLEGLLQPTVVIHDSQCWEVNEWFDPNVFTQTYLGISGMLGATKKNHPMLFPSTDVFPIFSIVFCSSRHCNLEMSSHLKIHRFTADHCPKETRQCHVDLFISTWTVPWWRTQGFSWKGFGVRVYWVYWDPDFTCIINHGLYICVIQVLWSTLGIFPSSWALGYGQWASTHEKCIIMWFMRPRCLHSYGMDDQAPHS